MSMWREAGRGTGREGRKGKRVRSGESSLFYSVRHSCLLPGNCGVEHTWLLPGNCGVELRQNANNRFIVAVSDVQRFSLSGFLSCFCFLHRWIVL